MKDSTQVRGIIAQAFSGMALLLMMMQITDLIEAGMQNDFSQFTNHLKMSGLWFISMMLCINILVQISVRTFQGRGFKWFIFIISLIYTLNMLHHQASHLIGGDRFDIHFVFDTLHHILGFWAVYYAHKWLQMGDAVNQSTPGRVAH